MAKDSLAKNVQDHSRLIQGATIPMIEAVTPLALMAGGGVIILFTMTAGIYIGLKASAMQDEAAERQYEYANSLIGLGGGAAVAFFTAGTTVMRIRSERDSERDSAPYGNPSPPLSPLPPSLPSTRPPPARGMRSVSPAGVPAEPALPEFPPRPPASPMRPAARQDHSAQQIAMLAKDLAQKLEQATEKPPTRGEKGG